MPGRNLQKIKQKISNTMRLNFCYMEVMGFLHPHYHPKIIEAILKNVQKHVRLVYWDFMINPLSANFTKWSNTLKQFIGKSVFDHFVGLALKGSNSFPISVVKRSLKRSPTKTQSVLSLKFTFFPRGPSRNFLSNNIKRI